MTTRTGAGASTRRRATRAAGPIGVANEPPAEPNNRLPDEALADAIEATAVVEAAESAPEPVAGTPTATARSRRQWAALIGAALLSAALLAGFIVFAVLDVSARDTQSTDQQFVDTAKQAVIDMTSLHHDTVKSDFQRLRSLASGQFAQQLDHGQQMFTQGIQDDQVVADGKVLSAGLQSRTGDDAVVLVASDMTVKNKGLDQAQQREFRFRVLLHDNGGTMTVTDLEAVT